MKIIDILHNIEFSAHFFQNPWKVHFCTLTSFQNKIWNSSSDKKEKNIYIVNDVWHTEWVKQTSFLETLCLTNNNKLVFFTKFLALLNYYQAHALGL